VSNLICAGLQRNQNCACIDIVSSGGFGPPGDSNNINGVWYEFGLAVKVNPLGGCGRISKVLAWMRLAV